mgnify:FL=1
MLLVVDIGNTNITLGVFDNDERKMIARMATLVNKTADQYAVELIQILNIYDVSKEDIDGCIVSSVVPVVTNAIKKALSLIKVKKTLFVGPGVKTGLDIKIDNPAQLGADLVVGAVAAIKLYKMPCIILDLGTATTLSVLDKNGAFLGGPICAGVGISLEALTSKTSQLPQISVETPKSVIGKNSVDSMKAGLVLGSACMIDGLIERVENEIGKVATVVATGGLAPEVVKNCKKDIIINDNLLLDGLKAIYEKNVK